MGCSEVAEEKRGRIPQGLFWGLLFLSGKGKGGMKKRREEQFLCLSFCSLGDDRELERDLLPSELEVRRSESAKLWFDVLLVLRVEVDDAEFGPIDAAADALPDDIGRERHVVQQCLVNGCQGAVVWPVNPGGPWLGENRSLPSENDMLSTELLLEFPHDLHLDPVV